MKTRSKALLMTLLLICSVSASTYGQEGDEPVIPPGFPEQDLRFQHLTTEDGLSEGRVWGILQDRQGFMWFTTWDGINRYDGYEFKVYREDYGNPNSPGGTAFWEIYEDRDGMIWVTSHTGGGLSRFNPTTEEWRRYQHDPDDPHSLSNNNVYDVYQDRMGVLWVATEGGGLNRFEGETEAGLARFTHYRAGPNDPSGLSSDLITSVYEDRSGELWIGSYGGLNRYDRETETFIHYQHDPDDPTSLSNNIVLPIYEDRSGVLWVGTWGGGLNRFDRGIETFTRYKHDPDDPHSLSGETITSILEDRAGVLWIGTLDGGLNHYDRETDTFLSYQHDPSDTRSLGTNNVSALFEDRSGILWIGVGGGGIDWLDPFGQGFGLIRQKPADSNSLSSSDVRCVLEDRAGNLWMGTWGGLNHYDLETETFAHYLHDPGDPGTLGDDHVWSCLEDREGVLWIGLDSGGLARLDRGTEDGLAARFTHFVHDPAEPQSLSDNDVTALYEDRAGILWVGTWAGGLNALDRQADDGHASFKRYLYNPEDPHSLSADFVWSIHEDSTGVLWIGTAGGGLCRFDRESEGFDCYQSDPEDDHSLSSNTVWAIHQDGEGSLWLGTDVGLNQFNPQTGQFTRYTTVDGLPHNSVVGILEDTPSSVDERGDLWLSTLGGLSRFDSQSRTFQNYDASHGLQGDVFNYGSHLKTSSGRMLFGGQQGLTYFNLKDVRENPNIPPVHVTGFALANEPVSIGSDSPLQKSIIETEQMELSYEDRVISFEFAALDYASPEKNRYRYKLEGFDERWTEVGSDRRSATYTNLDPGRYTFKVLGSNNDGVWNEEGTSINLTITPPWWGTWWFRGGMLLLLMGLVAGGFVWQRKSARRRERQLEATVAERTHKLDERVRQLDCLYGISRLAGQEGSSLEEILGGVVDLLPLAMQYPEIACARIVLNGQEFETDDLRETPWQQTSAIVVQGEQAGQVEVAYLEERPDADEGPFLAEERLLLNAVAERLGRIVERKQAEEALRVSEQKFKALFQGMPVPVYTWQRSGNDFVLVDHNDEAEAITGGKIRDFLGTTLPAMYPDRPDIVQDISHAFAGRASFQREMAYSFKSTGEAKTLVVKYAFVPPDLVLVQTEDITERKQAEEALRESESRFELAVAGSYGGLWSIDLDPEDPSLTLPDEIYLSPRLKGFLGYEDAEFPDSMAAWESHVHPEDLPRLLETSQKYRQGEIDRYELEYRMRHKDGSIRWLRTTGRVERDADGLPARFAGIDWDITEPIRVREQLQFQAQLLEAVGQAVVVTDLPGHVVYWNPSAERLYGWSAEEAMGRMTNELLVDSYDQQPIPEIRDHFLAGKSWTGEYTAYHRDGTPVPVETTITPVFNATGELAHVIGVASDITERKQAEEALRVSEKAYRDLVEKISDVIYAVDAGGVITYLNPAIESLIGLPPEQVVGQPFAQFIHPEDLERLQGNIQNLFSGVAPGPAEYRVLNVKGETRWIRVTSQPVVEGDRVTGVQGVLTDITVRKRVEEQLEEAAVREERSRLARDLHDSVTQTLYSTNLFADAAHLAMSTGRTDTATKHLDAVRELIWQAMLEMRLLLFELRPPLLEEIGLVGALESRLESVETRVGLPIEFRVDGDRQLPPAVESELYLVALEALNNIAKHAQANRATVHLRLDEERCRLVVQDDGSGFDPEAAGRGGGQGLRSMQERVAQLGGRLDLETAPGQGTTVTIEVKA